MRGALRGKKAEALETALTRIGIKPERAAELSLMGGLDTMLASCTTEESEDVEAALAIAAAIAMPNGPLMGSSDDVGRFFRSRLQDEKQELLYVALVDCRNRVIKIELVAKGGLVGLSVHPREILAPAIIAGAAGFILIHNHPSGLHEASQADRDLTYRVRQAGEIIGIPLHDHVVVARSGYASI